MVVFPLCIFQRPHLRAEDDWATLVVEDKDFLTHSKTFSGTDKAEKYIRVCMCTYKYIQYNSVMSIYIHTYLLIQNGVEKILLGTSAIDHLWVFQRQAHLGLIHIRIQVIS